ncbi:hypothetical protein FRB90_005276 [Tulasnella sp. 427]|nr:hypothetical protein FRB90_005276 [Tulasnella sp. 427]
MAITDLPVELLLDHVLPTLDLSSLLALAQTNKFFANLCSDDTFWRLKLGSDYNFTSNADTARESGWKVIYKGIRKPSVYTWGVAGQGRLGIKGIPREYRSGVPFPVKVDINARIVSLVAGGWSFHALDDAGRIYVWGQLQGEGYAMNRDGFSEPSKCATTPHRLQVSYPAAEPTDKTPTNPVKFTALSCGRAHSAALDSEHNSWLFTSWGRPIQLTSPLIHKTQTSDDQVVQVECGWGFVSMLNRGGNVFILWPWARGDEFRRAMDSLNETLDESQEHKASHTEVDGEDVIPCSSHSITASPLILPPIPHNLPELGHATEGFEVTLDASGKIVEAKHLDEGVKLVRIGAGDNFIIGLTNKGHVLSIDVSGGGEVEDGQGLEWLRGQWRSRLRQGWVYLPQYSEVEQVKQNPVFADTSGVEPPTKMKITHIAAHFKSFTAYSVSTSTAPHSSLVLVGNKDSDGNGELIFPQTIYPSLLQESIISLKLGDYHKAALTSTGKLYTWGSFSDGALGLGDPVNLPLGAPGAYDRQEDLNAARDGRFWNRPPEVTVPSAVRFDHLIKKDTKEKGKKASKKFVVSVAAAGWHTGALVIDLDGEAEEENVGLKGKEMDEPEDIEAVRYDGGFNPPPINHPMPGTWPFDVPRTTDHPPIVPEADSSDPYSTYEAPPFNPHASGNPSSSSSSGAPHPGFRFGLAAAGMGRGGLRGDTRSIAGGLGMLHPQHPPAGAVPHIPQAPGSTGHPSEPFDIATQSHVQPPDSENPPASSDAPAPSRGLHPLPRPPYTAQGPNSPIRHGPVIQYQEEEHGQGGASRQE